MKNRYTLMLLFKNLQIIRGSNVRGEKITIPRLHFNTIFSILNLNVLHSKFNCIQHFKLHKNWIWAINVNLMLKLKIV